MSGLLEIVLEGVVAAVVQVAVEWSWMVDAVVWVA